MPAAAVVIGYIEGFCKLEVNPLGPVQLYVAPGIFEAVRSILEDVGVPRTVTVWQTGLLLAAVGAEGDALTVTSTVPAGLGHPLMVAVTE